MSRDAFRDLRVLVTGGQGFLGRAVLRALERRGATQVLAPTRAQCDLLDESAVVHTIDDFRPQIVLHLAAEVGGIGANERSPGRFCYSNLHMGLHLIEAARRAEVRRFVQIGTVCSYPRDAAIPLREADYWAGEPESTNAPYGIAKKTLGILLEAYRRQYGMGSAMVVPVNLYGPGDHFDPELSHVVAALIRRAVEAAENGAPELVVWGTGRATREFLHVDDAAAGILGAAEHVDEPRPVNLGSGEEVSIHDLAHTIARLAGYEGRIVFDPSRPDGPPRRCVSSARARELFGFQASVSLEQGLADTIQWFRDQGPDREALR